MSTFAPWVMLLCGTVWFAAVLGGLVLQRHSMQARGAAIPWTGAVWIVPIAVVAIGLNVFSRQWEARRPEMYHQEKVTHGFLGELSKESGGKPAEAVLVETGTHEWSDALATWNPSHGVDPSRPRVRISGGIDSFSFRPIRVELHDPGPAEPWLDQLLLAYRLKGWRYEVVASSAAAPTTN